MFLVNTSKASNRGKRRYELPLDFPANKRAENNPSGGELNDDAGPAVPVVTYDDSVSNCRGGPGGQFLEERYPDIFGQFSQNPRAEASSEEEEVSSEDDLNDVHVALPSDCSSDIESLHSEEEQQDGFPENNVDFSYEDHYDVMEAMRVDLQRHLPPGHNVSIDLHYLSDLELDEPIPEASSRYSALLLPDQKLDASIDLQSQLSKASQGLQFDLLRLFADSNVTNKFATNILKTLKSAKVSDIYSLPCDHRGLRKTVPIESVQCWLTHICFEHQMRATYKYEFGQKARIPFPTCPNHRLMDYNADHYFVADVAQVLALVLPTIWKWRNEDYLPPHMVEIMTKNSLKFAEDITITLSSDGVQTFNSSNLSVWAVLGYVDGIPYHMQRKTVFTLAVLCARETGKSFQISSMLDDVLMQIERLNKMPFPWICSKNTVMSRVLVSRVIADIPARALMQGMNAFQSALGCTYCYQWEKGAYFPYTETMAELRTDAKFRRIYEHEHFEQETVRERLGVKFISKFARLPFDLVMGFPPDVMHCVYAGVTKLLIQMWISRPSRKSGAARKPYQMSRRTIRLLNSRLTGIRPPERTSRRPQELDKVGVWKAHELSMFLLYYGPVILYDTLPTAYYDHFIQLVAGIALLSTKITDENISNAQIYLDSFCKDMARLYTDECERFNVHLLRHLPKFCASHGILPLFSMYMFENENHRIVQYVNGPVAVGLQIFRKSMQRVMLNSREDLFNDSHNASGWLDWELPPIVLNGPVNNVQPLFEEVVHYAVYKPPHGKPRVVSKEYTMLKSRKSYIVMLDTGNIAKVLRYFIVKRTGRIYALVEEIEVRKHPDLGHIWYLHARLGQAVVPVSTFTEQVIEIDCEQRLSYSVYLNNIEHVAE